MKARICLFLLPLSLFDFEMMMKNLFLRASFRVKAHFFFTHKNAHHNDYSGRTKRRTFWSTFSSVPDGRSRCRIITRKLMNGCGTKDGREGEREGERERERVDIKYVACGHGSLLSFSLHAILVIRNCERGNIKPFVTLAIIKWQYPFQQRVYAFFLMLCKNH